MLCCHCCILLYFSLTPQFLLWWRCLNHPLTALYRREWPTSASPSPALPKVSQPYAAQSIAHKAEGHQCDISHSFFFLCMQVCPSQ